MALNVLTATILAGQSVSSAVDCSGAVRIVRIIMPSQWTAAPLTFCLSPDNVTFHDLYLTPEGSLTPFEATLPVIPGAIVTMPRDTGYQIAWFKVRSGNHAAPVPQAADRVFKIIAQVLDETTGGGGAGIQGPTGPMGDFGPTGATGATGLKGSTGGQGIQGIPGTPGGQGPQGIPGPSGGQGATGLQGPTGSQGIQGGAGVLGPAGPTGATGPATVKGVTDGSPAVAGDKGEYVSANSITPTNLTTLTTSNVEAFGRFVTGM